MSYTFNNNTILATTTTDASANTLFNYKINGVDAIFLKPFSGTIASPYERVLIDIPRFHAKALNYYYNSALDLSFCPKYNLHTTSQTGVTVPSGVTTMFVVCIGGGGGGGGGGVIDGGSNNGGSGGSGGGGALNGWFVENNSPTPTYNVTIGSGGAFGRPSGNTTVSEGRISKDGEYGSGSSGGNGSSTSFVYNGTTYSSNGGSGGGGGGTSGGTSGGGGTGGGTPTPFIWKDGIAGGSGSRLDYEDNIASGRNGRSGNHDTITDVNASLYINKKLINIENRKNKSADETDAYYTYYQTEYGDGGRGGRGEANSTNNWAWAGYSGNPGCAIVFFYYNNILTSAPLVTTVTTTSTHTLNASTTSFKIIVIGGGGGGQAGVQYDGANLGGCGGGGASGTSGVYFTKNIPSNRQLSITIGAGGLNGGRSSWDTSTGYQYPLTSGDSTDGGSTIVTWNSSSISIEAYGGKQAVTWGADPPSGSGANGGLGGDVATSNPAVTNNVGITSIFFTTGIAGTAGSNESAGTNGVGGAGGSTSNLSAYLSKYGPAITLGTYGYGGAGGKGEASNRDNPDGASPGNTSSNGVVIIIEY